MSLASVGVTDKLVVSEGVSVKSVAYVIVSVKSVSSVRAVNAASSCFCWLHCSGCFFCYLNCNVCCFCCWLSVLSVDGTVLFYGISSVSGVHGSPGDGHLRGYKWDCKSRPAVHRTNVQHYTNFAAKPDLIQDSLLPRRLDRKSISMLANNLILHPIQNQVNVQLFHSHVKITVSQMTS